MRKLFIPAICILVIIASCSKKTSAPTKNINAAPLFSNNCARCHGADGATGRAPNLTKTELSKGEIVDIINSGKGRMPSFTDKLSAQEISAVAEFVLKLKK